MHLIKPSFKNNCIQIISCQYENNKATEFIPSFP